MLNQNMLRTDDTITAVDVDDELDVVVVRTKQSTNFDEKLRKRTLTSGCAQGMSFGDVMERFSAIRVDSAASIRTSWLITLSRKIHPTKSYSEAGAIHGSVLCEADRPPLCMEDVGRHNALDKIAGYMHDAGMTGAGKLLYTTGRLTSEMVIKTVQMRIAVLVSRSGFTASGVDLAPQAGLTLIGRANGRRFVVLSGKERLVFDVAQIEGEALPDRYRKSGRAEHD